MKRKPKTGLGILAIGVALLITATFAARDLNQHKTSRVQTTFAQDNVVLVEKFNPDDALDWKKNEVVEKEVFVRNGQDTDDKDKYIYENAYVRIQIKEYLEFINYEYTYSDERLMVDTKGDFIKEASRVDLETWMTANDIPDITRIVELQGYYDTQPSFYIATQYEDINGEYGKHLILDRDDSKSESIVVGQTNQTLDAIDRHHEIINDEELYTTHTWSDREYISYADTTNPISHYVKVGLGNDVITKQAWIASGAQPVKKWILDTDSTEGWAYWGDILTHDTTITNIESITSNLIESVELIRTLEGQAEYYNRVSLDAVSFEDMDMWLDAPDEILDAFGVTKDVLAGTRKKLEQLINKVETINYELYYEMNVALSESQSVLANEEATLTELQASFDSLNATYIAFLKDEPNFMRQNMITLLHEIGLIPLETYNDNFKDDLVAAKENAIVVLDNQNATDEEIKLKSDSLHNAYNTFTANILNYAKRSLESQIDVVESIDYEIYFNMTKALKHALAVLQNEESLATINNAFTLLNTEYMQFQTDELTYLKDNINSLISDSENKQNTRLLGSSQELIDETLSTSKPILINGASIAEDLRTASKALNIANNKLRLASDGPIPEGGKVLDFAGQDWVVLHEDGEGHALIALDRQLQPADYTKIGISADDGTFGVGVKFHSTQTEYFPSGYETSKLKQTDAAFYNTFVKDHVDNDAVLPVEITQEVTITDTNQSYARTDAPTVINVSTGTKTAFSLSMSDMNVYNVQIPRKLMSNVHELGSTYPKGFYTSLRTPSSANARFLTLQQFKSDGSFNKSNNGSASVINALPVIPCMWITIGS